MRFTSHLDLHRTWERTLRRANLPLTYSQGFKPHARINLTCALPLGFTSQNDVVEIQLDEEIPVQEVESRLRKASPAGLLIQSVEPIEPGSPKLQALLVAQEYVITFQERLGNLEQRIDTLVQAQSIPRRRNNKTYDLRPLILDIRVLSPDELGQARLLTRLSAREGATGRPEEVILALEGTPESCRVHRTGLIFRPQTERLPESE